MAGSPEDPDFGVRLVRAIGSSLVVRLGRFGAPSFSPSRSVRARIRTAGSAVPQELGGPVRLEQAHQDVDARRRIQRPDRVDDFTTATLG